MRKKINLFHRFEAVFTISSLLLFLSYCVESSFLFVEAYSVPSASTTPTVKLPLDSSPRSTTKDNDNNKNKNNNSNKPTDLLKWLIVGGGPHGVHIATRLLGEVPTTSLSNLCIVDDEPQLLHKWKTRTAATGMTYLRSSSSYHLDVKEDSLRQYAYATTANTENHNSMQRIRESGTIATRRRNRKKSNNNNTPMIFASDYKRPLLSFFNQHCDYVIEENHLHDVHIQGMVTDIIPHDDYVKVQIKRPTGDITETYAENIVLALGSDTPAYPNWVHDEMIQTGKVRHIFDGENNKKMNDDVQNNNHSQHHHHRSIAIVGGGISAAHLALKLQREATAAAAAAKNLNENNADNNVQTTTTIHIICRHALREQQFDTHQDWMMDSYAIKRSLDGGGQGMPQCQRHFANLDSFIERRNVIQKERKAGTISASVSRGKDGLRYAIQSEHVHWHEGDIKDVVSSSLITLEKDKNGDNHDSLSLSLTSGKSIEVDEVILAKGFGKRPPGSELINKIVRRRDDLPICPCGYPAPDKSLRWHKRIFLAGALAELELGPSARNIAGARLASERIVAAATAAAATTS